MVLGFKERFRIPILNGVKIHTIREDKHNRWKEGDVIHFATGVRTPRYKCFNIGKCVSVGHIQISPILNIETGRQDIEIYIDGEKLTRYGIDLLVHNDGFSTLKDFKDFFKTEFRGKIIHWTDLKY